MFKKIKVILFFLRSEQNKPRQAILSSKGQLDPIKSYFFHHQKPCKEEFFNQKNEIKYLSESQINQIDREADMKLDEILESNISREEINGDKKRGVPIKMNPFFQLIRNDKKIRQNYLRKNSEYTVDNIINLAVNQNINYDTASSGRGQRIISKQEQKEPIFEKYQDDFLAEQKFKLEDPYDYFVTSKEPQPEDYKQDDTYHYFKPLYRKELEKPEIKIDPKKLHWRNPKYLCKFLTNYSTIKRRKYSGLDIISQKKVAKAIKHSRALNILPSYAYLKSYHKKPLTSLEQDLELEIDMEIDLSTGTLQQRQYEDNEDPHEFDQSHFKKSVQILSTRDIDYNDQQQIFMQNVLQEASQYAKFLKQKHQEKIGNSTIKFVQKEEKIYAEKLTIKDSEEIKESYQILENSLNIDFKDFQNILIAEKMNDMDGIMESLQKNINEEELNELEEISYEEIFDSLQNIKQNY